MTAAHPKRIGLIGLTPAKKIPFGGPSIDRIIDNISDNSWEDIADHLCGVKELESAIDTFNAANAELVSYDTDYQRTVAVPSYDDVMACQIEAERGETGELY